MKKLVLTLLIALSACFSFANHITGGTIFYTLVSQSGNNYTYRVTLKLYRDGNAPPGSAELDNTAAIGIFNRVTGATI